LGAMDSRRLEANHVMSGPITAIYNWVAYLEERIYKQIPPPDIAIRLTVSLETAKRRNKERIKVEKEQDAELEFRHRQSLSWHMSGANCVHDIDTDQSLTETVLSTKRVIWEWL
jgi:thymidylate kinase